MVYVAESGRGGDRLALGVIQGSPAMVCVGETGGITRISKRGNVARVVDLPSFAAASDPDGPDGPEPAVCDESVGFAAFGPRQRRRPWQESRLVNMGLGGSEEHRAELEAEFGTLLRVSPHQRVRIIADLVAYEQANNPDGGVPDSNPYGIDSYRGRSIVSDAGANDLLSVSSNGQIRTLAVFPNLGPVPVPELSCEPPPGFPPAGTLIPPQPVPTSVAVGPDGAYYVGTLTGFPFAPGNSAVYRVDPKSGQVTTFVGGLTHITGLDFGKDGSLYVAQMTDGSLLEGEICGEFVPGSVLKIKNGVTEVLGQFPMVGDVAVDRQGNVYVTTGSILPGFVGGGSVMKITP